MSETVPQKIPPGTLVFKLFAVLCAVFLVLVSLLIVYPAFCHLKAAHQDRARLDLKNLTGALKYHWHKTGRFPTTEEGLRPLVDSRALEAIPLDPWHNPYGYTLRESGVELWSLGADGRVGGEGLDEDIVVHYPEKSSPP